MNGHGSLLACEDNEEFAPLLDIANALFREMLVLGRYVGDWASPSQDDPYGEIKCRESHAYAALSRYLATEHIAAGYATVLLESEIGLRFSGQPFPYMFATYATALPGFPLGGKIPKDAAPPPGAVMYALSKHWSSLQERAGPEQALGKDAGPGLNEWGTGSGLNQFGSVVRGCIHVGRSHGFEAAVRYIYDLVGSGQVLFPAAAALAAGRVLRAVAAIGDERDLFNDVLGPPPETVIGAIEQEADLVCRKDPLLREVPPRVSAVLSDLLGACWGRVRQLRDAAQCGDWIFSLAGLRALIRFVHDTIGLTMDGLSPGVKVALRQLEEIAADCNVAWACLYREGFAGFVDYQRSVRSQMVRNSGSPARGDSRFRRERLMVPSWILEDGLDEVWARPDPACGRLIASVRGKDLALAASPFAAGAGPRSAASYSEPQADDELKEAARLLRQEHPWSETILARLGQALAKLHPIEAADMFTDALVLRPDSPDLWRALQQTCQITGRDRVADVAGRMAATFSGTSRA